MTGNSTSRALAGAAHEPCAWCSQPHTFPERLWPSPLAFSTERVEELLAKFSQVRAREIQRVVQVGAGSFSTPRGAGASRSWSATASSVSVCRRLKHAKSDATSGRAPSTRGTATSKTSDSSKSWNAVDDTIGTAARTPAERCADGDHLWGFEDRYPDDWFCVRGCGQRFGDPKVEKPCTYYAISLTGRHIPCVAAGAHHFHEFYSA